MSFCTDDFQGMPTSILTFGKPVDFPAWDDCRYRALTDDPEDDQTMIVFFKVSSEPPMYKGPAVVANSSDHAAALDTQAALALSVHFFVSYKDELALRTSIPLESLSI